MLADAFIDLWSISLDPSIDSRVIHIESTLFHHLFNISIRELIPAIPAYAQENDCRLEVSPLKRR
jgi:hypothetical protein